LELAGGIAADVVTPGRNGFIADAIVCCPVCNPIGFKNRPKVVARRKKKKMEILLSY